MTFRQFKIFSIFATSESVLNNRYSVECIFWG